MSDAKQLTDRFWALFEEGKLTELAEIMDPDVHFKMPGYDTRGRAPLLQMLEAYKRAFPDLKHQPHHWVENGDTYAVELTATGTHTGPMQTPQGTIPPTGNKVSFDSCDYIRVARGRIVSWHVYHDSVPFLTAMGLLPKLGA
jgi:ketosteroid isomerase-like protein